MGLALRRDGQRLGRSWALVFQLVAWYLRILLVLRSLGYAIDSVVWRPVPATKAPITQKAAPQASGTAYIVARRPSSGLFGRSLGLHRDVIIHRVFRNSHNASDCGDGWNEGFDHWLYHTTLGGCVFLGGFAVIAICALREILRFIVRILLKLL
jgi:hypothetical protein